MSQQPELTGNEAPEEGEEKKKKKQEALTLGQELFQTLQSLACIVLVIIFLFTFVMRITIVDGQSMENTLHHGDIVLVRSIGYTPKQGDIVVLTKTTFREASIIKRVIATEGQTVDIDYATSTVYVDGVALEEDYIKEARWDLYADNGVNHITVPEGHIYVMGDNRNGSSDSRDPSLGVVDVRCVIGQAVMVLFPFSDFGSL